MLSKNFHIQRGDGVQTLPQNDVFQSFNLQSKWGLLEVLLLVDGQSEGLEKNKLAALVVQQCLTELRSLLKTADKLEGALEDALRNVHAQVRNQRRLDATLERQSVDIAITVVLKGSVSIALSGRLAVLRIKGEQVDILAEPKGAGAFGQTADFQPQTLPQLTLKPGEDIVIASDGIHGGSLARWRTIRKEELVETLKNEKDLKNAAKRLVSYPLGRNVEEDISVLILRRESTQMAKSRWLAPTTLAAVALFVYLGYQFLPAPRAADNGRATVNNSTGLVFHIDPDGTHETISGFALIPALHGLSTGVNSSASVLVRQVDLYLGPETRLLFRQIESEAAGEEHRVILEVDTQSWFLLQRDVLPEEFVLHNGEHSFSLPPNLRGQIAIRANQERLEFYCLLGGCLAIVHDQSYSLEPGYKLSFSVEAADAGVVDYSMIPTIDKAQLQQDCNCQLP